MGLRADPGALKNLGRALGPDKDGGGSNYENVGQMADHTSYVAAVSVMEKEPPLTVFAEAIAASGPGAARHPRDRFSGNGGQTGPVRSQKPSQRVTIHHKALAGPK